MLQANKPRVRKWLNQERPPAEYLLELPATWQEMPAEVLANVYSAEDVPKLPVGIDVSSINNSVRIFPLRRSRIMVPQNASAASADPMLAVGRLLAGVLQGPARSFGNEAANVVTVLPAHSQGNQRPGQLALQDLPKDREVSQDVSKVSTGPAAAGAQMQDALAAASTTAQENLANKRVPAGSAQAGQSGQQLTEHLDALRDGLRAEAPEESKGALKRPACNEASRCSVRGEAFIQACGCVEAASSEQRSFKGDKEVCCGSFQTSFKGDKEVCCGSFQTRRPCAVVGIHSNGFEAALPHRLRDMSLSCILLQFVLA